MSIEIKPAPVLPVARPAGQLAVSFEFFPPKTEKMQRLPVGLRQAP